MSRPNVEHRIELVFEMPGTPAQVWDAIATGKGISSWFLETDLEERVGGAIVTHMGEDASSPGTVTGWEPQKRVAYEEPEWASLAQHGGADVTPLATEFLVEAQSGGTCVVRVVSSAFGTGADWEGEFFAEMEKMWRPFFDRLRLYLAHFPGQTVTRMEVEAQFPGGPQPLWATMRQTLGVDAVGDELSIRDIRGVVENVDDVQVLVRLTAPLPGLLAFVAYGSDENKASGAVHGHLFSHDAPAFVERERPLWKAWLEGLAVPAA
jgi:uncharacterized protein YndB with AHSA1/START domain